jgi:hypothetical protein
LQRATNTAVILRSAPEARVSKDGHSTDRASILRDGRAQMRVTSMGGVLFSAPLMAAVFPGA